MDTINKVMHKIFGASWFTSLCGYIVIAGGIAELVLEGMKENGVPTNPTGWLALVTGVALRAAKQANVSNAVVPLAVAQPVKAEVGDVIADPPAAEVKQ